MGGVADDLVRLDVWHLAVDVVPVVAERGQDLGEPSLHTSGQHLAQDPRTAFGDRLGGAGQHVGLGCFGIDLHDRGSDPRLGDVVVQRLDLDLDLLRRWPEALGERIRTVRRVGEVERRLTVLGAECHGFGPECEAVVGGEISCLVGELGHRLERVHLSVAERAGEAGVDADIRADVEHRSGTGRIQHRQIASQGGRFIARETGVGQRTGHEHVTRHGHCQERSRGSSADLRQRQRNRTGCRKLSLSPGRTRRRCGR